MTVDDPGLDTDRRHGPADSYPAFSANPAIAERIGGCIAYGCCPDRRMLAFGPLAGQSENHICINSEFGVTLVFAGLETRLRRRQSSFIHGVGDDARDPKNQLLNYLDKTSAS